MHKIVTQRVFNAPIEKVWALVADFSNLDWNSIPQKVEVIKADRDDRVGEIRRIFMPNMPAAVDEVLESIDPEKHSLRYSVPESPVENHQVVITLLTVEENKTYAEWHASFGESLVDGLTAEMMIGIIQKAYNSMLDELEAAVTN